MVPKSSQEVHAQQETESDQSHERATATARKTNWAKMAMSVANPGSRRHRRRDFVSRSGPGGGRGDWHDVAPFSRNASAARWRVILSRVDQPGSPEPAIPVPAILEKRASAALNLLSKYSYPCRFGWNIPAARLAASVIELSTEGLSTIMSCRGWRGHGPASITRATRS